MATHIIGTRREWLAARLALRGVVTMVRQRIMPADRRQTRAPLMMIARSALLRRVT